MSVAVLVAGVLTVSSAHAGSGLIRKTHADTPYRASAKPAIFTVARQTKPAIQVAVMAKAPAKPVATRAVFIHR